MTPLSSKLQALGLVGAISVMSGAIYLSPTGDAVRDTVDDAVRKVLPGVGPKATPEAAAKKKASSAAPSSGGGRAPSAAFVPSPDAPFVPVSATSAPRPTDADGSASTDDGRASTDGTWRPGDETPGTDGPGGSPGPRGPEGCWSFTWQQDAQAYYEKDLSDPLGLDGAKGPANGDGLACLQLPVDPDRPASTPVGAFEPDLPSKDEILATSFKYFGVAEDGIPGDTRLMDKLADQAGKSPSMVEWFSTWDEPYTQTKVDRSWDRGSLPVITWMPAHKGNKQPEDTSQEKILDGEWDDYIATYAKAVAADGKPVVMRFAHEQNGNWYPWSAGGNRAFYQGTRGEPYENTSEGFKKMWRHVWEIFKENGANDYAIWAWTPVRADTLRANTTDQSRTSFGITNLEDSYPGDEYVDWTGMSGYSYTGTQWSYTNTFAKTFDRLKAVAPSKKILVAETGAAENTGAQSNRERKAAWIADSLAGFGAEPSLAGFVWFNNTVVDVHTVDGVQITTDNKWDTSPESLAAFRTGIADKVWLTGVAPDTVVTQGSTGSDEKAATATR